MDRPPVLSDWPAAPMGAFSALSAATDPVAVFGADMELMVGSEKVKKEQCSETYVRK